MLSENFWLPILALLLLAFSLKVEASQSKKPAHAKKASSSASKANSAKKGLDLSSAYNSYLDRLRSKVYGIWDINEVTGKNHVVLQVTVAADGSATDLSLTSTPANPAAEEAASAAFNKAQPLESLPSGSPPARVTMTFDSTYDPHGDSTSNMGMSLKPLPNQAAKPSNAGASESSTSQ
jgi:TonB family protein